MSDITADGTRDDGDELEDLEPEPGDAENIKGGAAQDSGTDSGNRGGRG